MSAVTTYQPPPGWVVVPSKRQGIVVFAPPPEAAAPEAPITAACPTCGAPMAFEPTKQALVCAGCGSERGAGPRVGKLEGAQGQEFTLEALRRGARGWGVERRTLHCAGCGTDLVVDPGALSTTCPFCASHQVELVAGDPEAVRPGYVLPFQVRGDALAERVRAWLARGWMFPSSLAELAKVERLVGVYLPYWVFDARTRASYRCEVGTDHTVTHSDGDGGTTTTTETTWRWKEGAIDEAWTGVKVPGTARLSQVLLERVHRGFDTGACVPYDPSVLAGFQAQSYDRALPEAWELGRAAIRDLAKGACEAHAKRGGGDHVRNLTMSASLDDEVWRYVLLPVYLSAYRFGDRTFQVLVNGQTGVVQGQKPVVWWRIYAAIALFLSPAVCSGLVSLPLMLVGVGFFTIVLAFVLLVGGIIGSVWVWKSATEAEAA